MLDASALESVHVDHAFMLLMLLMSLCRNLPAWVSNTCNNNLALFAVWTGAHDRGHFRWGSNVNSKGWLIEYQDIFYIISHSNLVIKMIGQDLSTGQTAEHTQINCLVFASGVILLWKLPLLMVVCYLEAPNIWNMTCPCIIFCTFYWCDFSLKKSEVYLYITW